MAERDKNGAVGPTLSEERAKRIVEAALRTANAMNARVTLVTVDESGVLKQMMRMDGAPVVSVQTAINMACAAAAIGMPPDASMPQLSLTVPPWLPLQPEPAWLSSPAGCRFSRIVK